MKMWFGILAILLCVSSSLSQDVLDRWQSSWVCKSNKCSKTDFLTSPSRSEVGSTQDICRLTCAPHGSIWPMPRGKTSLSRQVIAFHPSRVQINLAENENRLVKDYLQKVSKIFQNNLLVQCGANCSVLPNTNVNIVLKVSSVDTTLNWSTDESYDLAVKTEGTNVAILIQCKTIFGCRHGLETLIQLTTSYSTYNAYSYGGEVLVIVTEARVVDSPAYPHRGLLLDTARNYLSVQTIERMLDGMGMTKLNVLHWHVTDTQSFPLYLPRLPQMSRFGAYSQREIYTVSDVQYLLQYARLRGVRIIMEIDAPAHAGNGWQWGEAAGLGKFAVCVNQQPWRQYCVQPPCGQLNPANLNVYNVLREMYRDIVNMMPLGEVFHMGGDEVYFPCWNSSVEIVSWLQENGRGREFDDFLQLWAEYQATALQVFDEQTSAPNTPIVLWSSHLTTPAVIEKFLDKERYVIQPWVEADNDLPNQLLDKGYKLIISTKDKWYLDHGFWGKTTYHGWREAYDNKLPNHRNVLGGETAMWGELVDDNSVDVKVWPRTAAVGERLWTNPNTSSSTADSRFQHFRQRLVKRGIRADALGPQYCYQNEGQCL